MIAKTEMCRKIQVNQSRETLEKKKNLENGITVNKLFYSMFICLGAMFTPRLSREFDSGVWVFNYTLSFSVPEPKVHRQGKPVSYTHLDVYKRQG